MEEKKEKIKLVEKLNLERKIDKKLLNCLPFQCLKNMCEFNKEAYKILSDKVDDMDAILKTSKKHKMCRIDYLLSILCLVSGASQLYPLIKNFNYTSLILTTFSFTSSLYFLVTSLQSINKLDKTVENLAIDMYFRLEEENHRISEVESTKLIFPELT